jgi:hypothetical protein
MKFRLIIIAFITTYYLIIAGCATVPKNPLITAISKGDAVSVKHLVNNGSNINETDSSGTTPLIHAVGSGNIEMVKTVLSLGADVNQRDKSGKTAMYHATYQYYNDITKLLFLADRAMGKGGPSEVSKVCKDFQEDVIVIPKGRPLYEGYLNYRYLFPKINYKGNKRLAIIVSDKRPYILSKEKDVGYVGLWRERGVLRPYIYDIGTLSRKSLANDLTFCISLALNDIGFVIEDDFDQNKSQLPHTDVDRIIYIEVQEWMTDTFAATGLWYDLTLNIFDGKNVQLGTAHLKGEDNLGGESHSSLYEIVPPTTENILSKLLNAPDIQSALKD